LLPFPARSFDVVLSNHVIEHVLNQRLHLGEIRRVLADRGVCYLATPNRSSPLMQGHVGNNLVLRYREMRPLFEQNGFNVHEYGARVLTHPRRFRYPVSVGGLIPLGIAQRLAPFFPSHMFVLTPTHSTRHE
jgi:SAM-dependent methyltransferase